MRNWASRGSLPAARCKRSRPGVPYQNLQTAHAIAAAPAPRRPLMQMTKVVVMDDFAWARKYAHIVPANVIASPYLTQYGTTSTDPHAYGGMPQ